MQRLASQVIRVNSILLAVSAIIAMVFCCANARADALLPYRVVNTNLQRTANGVVALIGYAVVPDVTTSSLSINNGSSGNPGLWSTQLGGGATDLPPQNRSSENQGFLANLMPSRAGDWP